MSDPVKTESARTVPPEAWDDEHPDHEHYVRQTGRCYGECVEHEAFRVRLTRPGTTPEVDDV